MKVWLEKYLGEVVIILHFISFEPHSQHVG